MPSKDKIKRIKQQRKAWKELAKSFLHEGHRDLKLKWFTDVDKRDTAKHLHGWIDVLDTAGKPITMQLDRPDEFNNRAYLMGCKIVEPRRQAVRRT